MATTAEPFSATTSEMRGGPTKSKAWGTDAADQPLKPMEIERRALRPDDVAIRITPAGAGSRVDMRSKSRVGRSDVGTNAHRIQEFLGRMR